MGTVGRCGGKKRKYAVQLGFKRGLERGVPAYKGATTF